MHYQISGLSSMEDYSSYDGDCPYQQLSLVEEFPIPEELPDIFTVNQVNIKTRSTGYHFITGTPRPKLLVKGEINLQIIYTSSQSISPVHTISFNSYFETFLNISFQLTSSLSVKSIHLLPENVTIHKIHGRKIKFFILLYNYAVLK